MDALSGEEAQASAPVARGAVYVVDGDIAARREAVRVLAGHGYDARGYARGAAFLETYAKLPRGCLIVDVGMAGSDGLPLHKTLRHCAPPMPMVIVAAGADVATAVRAMKAGAVDFLEKPVAPEALLQAVEEAMERLHGESGLGIAGETAAALVAKLTRREREVLARLIDGLSNKVIAHTLDISPRTVEIHRANVMEKLGCRSVAEAVRIAIAAGFAGS